MLICLGRRRGNADVNVNPRDTVADWAFSICENAFEMLCATAEGQK
jgi:hypothetical protein